MGFPAIKSRHSIAEYLRMEEKSDVRHEFRDGEILAMSGCTYGHDQVKNRLFVLIANALAGKPCRLSSSDMRIRIPNRPNYLYPDMSIVCGAPQFDENDPRQMTVSNPRVVVEVLSDTTESYDRGAKFHLYQQIAALEEYVLVGQNRAHVESFRRQAKGTWLMTAWKGKKEIAKLQSVKIALPLGKIYAGMALEEISRFEGSGG